MSPSLQNFLPENIMGTFLDCHSLFQQTPLSSPIFINSIPKCGTMLIRNIILMFVPLEEIHWPFVHNGNLETYAREMEIKRFKCFTGHMQRTSKSLVSLRGFRHILNIRDPRDYVLSYAHFFFTEQLYESSKMARHIQDNELGFDVAVDTLIRGWKFKDQAHHGVLEMFTNNGLSWFGSNCHIVRYEELKKHVENVGSQESHVYFKSMFDFLGIELTEDWEIRVKKGADYRISKTSSEKMPSDVARRWEMTPEQKELLEQWAPGLRAQLGYQD